MNVRIVHPLEPIFDSRSRVLILGTMPSPRSREAHFYYAHPRNRFWPTLAALFHEELPVGNDARTDFALRHGIALWDVLHSCEIDGASDASIKDAVPNDLSVILNNAPIQQVFCTGTKAWSLYHRLIEPKVGLCATRLPSSSPANCAVSSERLCEAYSQILPYLLRAE